MTGIDKSAVERLGGPRDGNIDFQAYFNDASVQAHPVLSGLPTADRIVTYYHRTATIGDEVASLIGKQINSTVNNPSEQAGFWEAGKSRPLASFTPK